MSLWGKIKNNAKIGVQYIKEKTGTTQVEIDPEFEAANQKFCIIQENNTKFMSKLQVIIDLLPELDSMCVGISEAFANLSGSINKEKTQLAETQESFFRQISEIMRNELVEPANTVVIEEFRATIGKIEALTLLRNERRKTQLMCDSLRDECEKSRKDTPEHIVKTRKKYDLKQEELKEQTQNFIDHVNQMWENRFMIIEKPMTEFVSLLFTFCYKAYGCMATLHQELTEEELAFAFEPTQK